MRGAVSGRFPHSIGMVAHLVSSGLQGLLLIFLYGSFPGMRLDSFLGLYQGKDP